MGLLSKYYSNYRHPKGLLGRYVVRAMNGKRHGALAEWALNFVDIKEDAHVLDIGCGGGANVARMLAKYPKGTVNGVDFAPAATILPQHLKPFTTGPHSNYVFSRYTACSNPEAIS